MSTLTAKPRRRRTPAERRAAQEREDFNRAFNVSKRHPEGTTAPRYCPVRIDRNHINPPGNVCGLLHKADKPPEGVPREDESIIAWRCTRGHLFLRMPEASFK